MKEEKYYKSQFFNPSRTIEIADCTYFINYFTTNRGIYYINENMEINSSWNKDSGPWENSSLQIRILDSEYDIVWNSSEFYENGDNIEKNFTLSIENDLDLTFEGQSTYLTVSLFYFATDPLFEGYLDNNITIKILKEGNFSIADLNFNRNIFYPDEILEINMTYELLYDLEDEISYIEFRVFNNNKELLWNSSKFNEEGTLIERNLTIPIHNLILCGFSRSISLNITLYYYYKSLIRPIEKQEYFCDTIIKVIKKESSILPFMFDLNTNSNEIKVTNFSIIILLTSVIPFTSIIVILLVTKKRKILEDITIEY